MLTDFGPFLQELAQAPVDLAPRRFGLVTACDGGLIEATGLSVPVGARCGIAFGQDRPLAAEVIGFRNGRTMMMMLGDTVMLRPGARVRPEGRPGTLEVGRAFLGRAVDGEGKPIDGGGALHPEAHWPSGGVRTGALDRARVRDPFDMAQAARTGLTFDRADIADFRPGEALLGYVMLAMPPVLLLALPILLLTLVSQLGFGEGRFLGANLQPKAQRINPLSGLKRMFGLTGLIEIGKGMAKVILLGAIAWFWADDRVPRILGLGRGNLASDLAWSWDGIISLLFALSAGLVVIALVDLPVLWIRRNRRLRMSMQEMRDEHKEAEGSPENKAAIRQRQRQLAQGSLQHAMRDAQFVLTNPTHFSVAMAYDPSKASAPIVLAKGRGDKALAMRDVARELNLPTLEYPALARSVYFTTRERQVIREELYAAVASVLAFVLSLKRGEKRTRPLIEVPLDLRFDTEGRKDPAVAT